MNFGWTGGFRKNYLLVSVGIFVLIYLLFFPSFFASIDEHEYIRNAYLLQKGTLTEPDPTKACTGDFNGEGYISQYFIGRSIFIIPFTWFGLEAMLFSGLVIHLLNFFLFLKIMDRLSYNRKYSLLYLLYPVFFWSARTLNSELLVLTGLLAGLYFYFTDGRRKWFMSGFFFGLSILTRYESALILVPFLIVPLVKKREKMALMLLGMVPVLIVLFALNTAFYGGPLSTGYGSSVGFLQKIFTKEPIFLMSNAAIYFGILLMAYPLMSLSPSLKSRGRVEIGLSFLLFLVFYSVNSDPSIYAFLHPVTFTGRLRYLIPVVGMLLVAYIPMYKRIVGKFGINERKIFAVAAGSLFVVYLGASFVHADFIDGRYYIYQKIRENTEPGSLLIGRGEDCNYIGDWTGEDRRFIDISGDIEKHMQDFQNVYVLQIRYGTVDVGSNRGSKIGEEWKLVSEYIENNMNSLELVFESQGLNHIRIYRHEGMTG